MTTPCATRPDETRPDEDLPDAGGAPAAEVAPRGLRARWARLQAADEAGMSAAEYAVGSVAACAFAAVLYQVVTGGSIVTALGDLVESALTVLS